MKLLTKIPLKQQQHNQLDYNSNIMLFGSCFSENIGEKFKYYKFQTTVNPFGILFHPIAIQNVIERSINNSYYSEADLHCNEEQWMCLDVHSKLNQPSSAALLDVINTQLTETRKDLANASHVMLTLGTSWVYRHIKSNKIVANCHKIPQKNFLKELLSVAQITESLEAIISLVKSVNPNVSFLFTVSPVRHIKDGFIENTQSKSHLLTAIHDVINTRVQCYYFPSFEIMMDELRDYRFYDADMLHPNEVAINYIWEKFKSVWLTDDALKVSETVAAIQAKMAHRPSYPNSEAHQVFLSKLQLEIESLHKQFPHISF